MKQKLKKLVILLSIILAVNLYWTNYVRAVEEKNDVNEIGETSNVDEESKEEEQTESKKSNDAEKITNVKAGTDDNFKFTDFSKATYKWDKTSVNTVNLNIANVNFNSESLYFAIIKKDNSEVKLEDYFDENKSLNTEKSDLEFTTKRTNNSLDILSMQKYLELNQDIYVWIIEKSKDNLDFVVSGKKMEEFEFPKYAEAFYSTYCSSEGIQIPFNIPWASKTKRNITIKLGKITDNSILKNIKNNNEKGWTDLIKYAKSSNALWSEKATIDDIATYKTSKNPISTSKLSNKAYYYLYIDFDDENGKYRPIQAITLALSDVYTNKNSWFMFFLGEKDFNWDNLNTENPVTKTTPTPTKTPTNTIKPITTLPNTGKETFLITLLIGVVIGTIILKYKNDEYKGI